MFEMVISSVIILLLSALVSADGVLQSICFKCDCSAENPSVGSSPIQAVEIVCPNEGNYSDTANFVLPLRTSRLVMSKIELNQIPGKSFLVSSTLNRLDLSENSIESVPESAFEFLPRLKYLDLSKNLISKINRDSFQNCYELRTLILAQNGLLQLPYKFGDILPSLGTLDLSRNPLGAYFEGDGHFLHPLAYGEAPKLRSLNLDGIGLRMDAKTASFSLQGARNVENITLRDNKMEVLPDLPQYVQYLDISRTGLRMLESHTFPFLRSLRELVIQDAPQLHEIRPHAFSSLPGLKILLLDGCRNLEIMSELAFGRDVQESKLEELGLSGTSLRTLDQKLQTIIANVTKLDLSGAPWHCNCSASWLIPFAPPDLRCASPIALNGFVLSGLQPSDLLCVPESPYADKVSVVGILLAFGSLLLACVSIWVVCEGAKLSRRVYLQNHAGPHSGSPYGRVTVEPNNAEHL